MLLYLAFLDFVRISDSVSYFIVMQALLKYVVEADYIRPLYYAYETSSAFVNAEDRETFITKTSLLTSDNVGSISEEPFRNICMTLVHKHDCHSWKGKKIGSLQECC